jgi:phosphoglycerate kinase
MEKELKSLSKVLENPERPCVFIFGGAKADDSLEISKHVLDNNIADFVLTGGVVGQVFLVAKGIDLGPENMKLIRQEELMDLIPGIRKLVQQYSDRIKTPTDVAVDVHGKRQEIPVGKLPTEYSILDVGTKTVEDYSSVIRPAKTIVISGPLGVYENDQFSLGTRKVMDAIAMSKAFSLAGGGHTIGALQEFGLSNKISYISTAGGALVELLMGKKLPGVVALEEAADRKT